MLTPEREKEIREFKLFAPAIKELLAEIDRLREVADENANSCEALSREIDRLRMQNKDLKWEYDNCCDFANGYEEKLAVAVEALEYISRQGYTGADFVSREALSKIRST